MKVRTRFDAPAVVESVYEATLDPARWTTILESLGSAYHCCVAFFGLWLGNNAVILPKLTFGLTAAEETLWESMVLNKEINLQLHAATARRFGEVFRTEELVPIDQLRRTELYERLIRYTGGEYGVAVQLAPTPADWGALSLYHHWKTGPFGDDELASLRRLAPHIMRAVRVRLRLAEAESQAQLACETLDRFCTPIFLADTDGRIRFANAAARAVLAASDGFKTAHGRLEARCTGENRRLSGLVRGAALGDREGYLHPGGAISITRRDGRPAWEVVVAPLSSARHRKDWPVGELAMVVASNPVAGPISTLALLGQRYSLTPAEARLALIMLDGTGVKEAAEQLGVSNNTVRTHLQRIFEKTGAKRQAELVRLLASHPALSLRSPNCPARNS